MSRKGWQKRPFTTPRHTVPAFEVVEDPDDYERRLEEMREEAHAWDVEWEREQRLTARDFTNFTRALPVVADSTARASTTAGSPRGSGIAPCEHTRKEAA